MVFPTLNETLAEVGLAGAAGVWAAAWDESCAAMPAGELFFLQRDWIRATLDELAMPEEIVDAFHQGLDMFHKHPALRRLAWHCHHLLQAGIDKETQLKKWPTLPDLHPLAGMFYAYVFLAGLPAALRRHRERGIAADVTKATFSDLTLWMQDYRQKHGRWGLSELHATGWLQDHLEARLFRLGRLQFRMEEFPCDLLVYRQKDSIRPVMLAGPGQIFRPDGRFDGVNDLRAGPEAWRSTLEVRDGSVAGQVIDPRGFARPESAPAIPGFSMSSLRITCRRHPI
ncbi:MAG: acyltransferase domain-containing protein [Lentisphaerae bacterium]|nr:acyltransferase domain-containing protein [Lentisphaerota bacterium]